MTTGTKLTAGKKVGAYEIVEHVGSGGMGEVYRARDPRFKRDVAVKILPLDFANDPDRLQRFEQEAQAAGMLNHPNILSVYDTGMTNGSPYLVSEFVEGETLRQKLAAGGLSQRKAVDYGLQLARGLSAAHDKGIVHRDLKPENVMITKDGRLKILDFGLAKLRQQEAPGAPLTQLPTSPGTQPGIVLGTVGYMSPEQVRGKNADPRSDIFAFGAILYEMITGIRAFRGETPADTLSAILQKEPPEISETNHNISPALSRIVNHCLEKDPEQRFHSAGDIAFNLESLSGVSDQSGIAAVATARAKVPVNLWKLLTVAAIAALAVLSFFYYRTATKPQPLLHLSIDLPPGYATGPEQGGEISISPDGKYVAFCAYSVAERKWYLWIRSLSKPSPQFVKGSEEASAPFWSPDSQYVAFFSDDKLKKVKNDGGLVQTICDAPGGRGGSWNQKGTIIFSPQPYGPLYTVESSGGAPAAITKVSNAETSHRWPFFLPDGNHFLFTSLAPNGIYVAALDAPQPKLLNSESSNAIFVKPRTLLFAREGNLIAQPFDPKKLAFDGERVPVLQERLEHDTFRLIGFFSASERDSLIYRPRALPISRPTWFDRSGKPIGLAGPAAAYFGPAVFSPDGNLVTYGISDPETGKTDIWEYDFASNRLTRLTVGADNNGPAIWSPDQSHILFSEANKIYTKQTSAASPEQLLLESSQFLIITSCSPDGKYGLLNYQNPRGDWDIWVLPLFGDKKSYKFIETQQNDMNAVFSPDGKWVAFLSNATGQPQVYVTSFPDPHQQWQVSTEGGGPPRWRKDGKELVYVDKQKVMSVEVNGSAFSNPKLLFERPGESLSQPIAMHPDGQRFIQMLPTPEQNPDNIRFISNWTQEMRKR